MMVQTVKGCNLRCKYCYYDDAEVEILPPESYREILSGYIELFKPGHLHLTFHEGEPLLAGIKYYEELHAIEQELSRKYGVSFSHSCQTNATLINREWVEFFKRYRWNVGVSIDGIKEVHNRNRVYPGGKGSFKEVLRGVRLLREAFSRVGAICVLTSETIELASQIVKFAVKEGFTSLNLNPVAPTERTKRHGIDIDQEEYAHELIKAWHLKQKVNPAMKLNPIDDLREHMLRGYATGCRDTGYSGGVSADIHGDIYTCHRWNGNPEFKIGNFAERELELEKYERFKSRPKVLRATKCRECRWVRFCNGGCMANAYAANRSIFTRDYFCQSFRIIFSELEKSSPPESY